jgi:hypothetical protein
VGEPEVGEKGAVLRVKQHVSRLNVSMDDALGMGCIQRPRNPLHIAQSHVDGKRDSELIPKCPPTSDERHDKEPERRRIVELEVEQGKDIGVE